MTEEERRQKLSPQHNLLFELLTSRPPMCGIGTPTRIKDHLERARWYARACAGALIVALVGLAIKLLL